jgi:hypothetical protein
MQKMFVAVSSTSSATGSFYIYSFNAVVNPNDFFDFPMVGYDQDAIFVTANIFNPGFAGARMYYAAKANVYNGLPAGWSFFNNLAGTLAAPVVVEQSFHTWFVAPQPSFIPVNSYMSFYRFQNLGGGALATGVGPIDVSVPGGFGIPPEASQTGGNPLDTLDCRFQNVSTQVTGTRLSLYNVHCINYLGYPTPQWYEFDLSNPAAPTIRQLGRFHANSTSYDFNPHIAANKLGDCFVVWSVTDPANGKNAMVYFGGRRDSADLNTMGVNPIPLFTSFAWYDDTQGRPYNRWDDYSAVTIDPSDSSLSLKAWMTNETILGSSSPSRTWGTQIGAVTY